MQYRSPIRLVTHAGEAVHPYTPHAISRARKKLLAEIALSGELVLDGMAYARNDVITLLDGVGEQTWQMHEKVYLHASLLVFLEKGGFDPADFARLHDLSCDAAFVSFVSSYFATAFQDASRALLQQEQFGQLAALLGSHDFILAEDGDEAYRRLRLYFDECIYQVRNLGWEKFSADNSLLDFFFQQDFIAMVNALPPSFDTVRDSFTAQMLLLVERFQHKATWAYLRDVCAMLRQIACSHALQQEVEHFEGIMRRNVTATSSRAKWRRLFSTHGGWSVGWIIFIVLRMFSNGCDANPSRYQLSDGQLKVMRESAVSLQLSSSVNEQQFKKFLAAFAGKTNKGRHIAFPDSATPFPGVSMLPADGGPGTLVIHNRTSYDVVFFSFPSENLLNDTSARINARCIRQGGSCELGFNPNFTRFNLAFGHQWVRLDHPRDFLVTAAPQGTEPSRAEREGRKWIIRDYFRQPGSENSYLDHDLVIMDFKQRFATSNTAPVPDLLYQPTEPADGYGPKKAVLDLQESNGKLSIDCSGSLYIYKSTNTSH